MSVNIYLDDERVTPEGFDVRTYTKQQTIQQLIKNEGNVNILSLDHDLGDENNVGNGYLVLLWLEQHVAVCGMVPPKDIRVHSANAGARGKMEAAIAQIYKIYQQLEKE